MKNDHKKLEWWQLSLFGVGCIIGTGYFLGSSIAIKKSGPSFILAFILAGLSTIIVFSALAKLTADHPEQGSFRTYSKQAFGAWAGFCSGWVYWSSEMLIMGSQLTALGLFSKFWFPNIPLWMIAAVFAALGLVIILMGVQQVERMENLFGIMKFAAIVMFVILAVLALFGLLNRGDQPVSVSSNLDFFPNGLSGVWGALIYAFFAFGGIEVMGLMASDLKNPKEAPKSGTLMLLTLTILYVLSFTLVLFLVPWTSISADESPFLTALNSYDLSWVPHFFNAILIIAGFSTLVASLYAVTFMLVTMSEEGDAPSFFSKKGKLKIPLPAFGLTILMIGASILLAFLLPETLFEYITTAAGLMLLYAWIFILISYRKLMELSSVEQIKVWGGCVLIFLGISGTLLDQISRPGFFVSLLFLSVIGVASYLKNKKKEKI